MFWNLYGDVCEGYDGYFNKHIAIFEHNLALQFHSCLEAAHLSLWISLSGE